MTSPPQPYDPDTAKAVRGLLVTIIGLSAFLLGVLGGAWTAQRTHALGDLCEETSPSSVGSPPTS